MKTMTGFKGGISFYEHSCNVLGFKLTNHRRLVSSSYFQKGEHHG